MVADEGRTEKTICLAVSPSLKTFRIPGRARLFEVVQKVKDVNFDRKRIIKRDFSGESYNIDELNNNPNLKLTYLVAKPRMSLYMEYSTRIFDIYLRYVAPEDMHVYSVDEVFIDATNYLKTYNMTPEELARTMIKDVLKETGITATAGIGTNMYLCKVAMDIEAKHQAADENGVRIAYLDEKKYRELLWDHTPLTDFWRVGSGYAKKLKDNGIYTMGDIARCSLGDENAFYNEDLLYKLFGVNAELLIDHAWGYEPVTISDIKSYRPERNSISEGQVLKEPYTTEMTRLVIKEMSDVMVDRLIENKLVTNQLVLTVCYDINNLVDPKILAKYHGEVTTDRYGRRVPKHAHGTENLTKYTSSEREIKEGMLRLFDRIINPDLLTRRIYVIAANVIPESENKEKEVQYYQMDLFTDYEKLEKEKKEQEAKKEKERRLQEAMLSVKKKYGKNAILKGNNLEEGATQIERNGFIGGHKA